MKKLHRFATLAFVAAWLLLLQGCLKDSCSRTFKLYKPIFKTLAEVRADMKSKEPQALKNTGKVNVYGNYIFLNEVGKGIHVINNTNPSDPKNIGFINIPNNIDLAVKGNYLFADSYSDIIVFDITNPTNVTPVKFLDNVMKEKNVYWNTSLSNDPTKVQVAVGYTEKDTTVDCSSNNVFTNCPSCSATSDSRGLSFYSAAAPPSVGVGGSMAGFTIINDFLYCISSSSLYTINISSPQNATKASEKNMLWGIETIYPFQNKLFIGSRTGMFIFDLSNPSSPTQQGTFSHVTSCDPVIADGQYAYVTLRGGTTCNASVNELNVLDISNFSAPLLKARLPLTNPYGLAKDGNTLLVCDGKEGLRIYDASSPLNLQLTTKVSGLETYDVIALNSKAIVVAKDGLYQYDYSNRSTPTLLSKISINKN